MNQVLELQKEMKLHLSLLESHCIPVGVGVEAIDPKVFLQHLRKLTTKSTQLLKLLMEDNKDVRIDFVSAGDVRLSPKVAKTPFLVAGANTIYCPVGFVGFYSDFLKLILANRTDLLNTRNALLDANALFAQYNKKPETLFKLDVASIPKLPKVKKLAPELADFFKGEEGQDKGRLEDLYKSWHDVADCGDVIQKLTKELKGISLKDIKEKTDELYDVIDRLTLKLDNGEIEISKPVAKSLGNLVFDLADWLAIFSLAVTKTLALIKAHSDNIELLNNLA